MIVSFKDAFKLLGISIICCLMMFVSTFFLNYYLDVINLRSEIADNLIPLYDAQIAMAKFTSAISGGCLTIISALMLIFYIRLYITSHVSHLGILKAMGYSDGMLALRFAVFGASVFIGAIVGFAAAFIAMPTIYESMTVDGMGKIAIHFHVTLLILLVFVPTIVFSALSCLCAYISLRRPVGEMLRGKSAVKEKSKIIEGREREFLKEMRAQTLKSKKSLAFFTAFSAFCFSAMVQMSISMRDMTSLTMYLMIFMIGVILAVTSLVMSVTSLINGNIKNISIMKAFGYSVRECSRAVFGGYRLFAYIGFAIGTAYQFGLLQLMLGVFFKGVDVPEYSFDVPAFFITLAAFAVLYELAMFLYSLKLDKILVKEVMLET